MKFIFDNMQLNELLNNFYTLTKIRIVIFDKSFNKIYKFQYKKCHILSNKYTQHLSVFMEDV